MGKHLQNRLQNVPAALARFQHMENTIFVNRCHRSPQNIDDPEDKTKDHYRPMELFP